MHIVSLIFRELTTDRGVRLRALSLIAAKFARWCSSGMRPACQRTVDQALLSFYGRREGACGGCGGGGDNGGDGAGCCVCLAAVIEFAIALVCAAISERIARNSSVNLCGRLSILEFSEFNCVAKNPSTKTKATRNMEMTAKVIGLTTLRAS